MASRRELQWQVVILTDVMLRRLSDDELRALVNDIEEHRIHYVGGDLQCVNNAAVSSLVEGVKREMARRFEAA